MENAPVFTVSPSVLRPVHREEPRRDNPFAAVLAGVVFTVAGCAVAIPFALYIYLPLVR